MTDSQSKLRAFYNFICNALTKLSSPVTARLTVIVSQSLARDSHTANIEQELVAKLMMAAGLDATLIGPLERVEPESTDFLCLNSFQHSVAVATWLTAEGVAEHWRRLGLGGTIREIGSASAVTASQGRHIYHLSLASSADRMLGELDRIRREREIQTVGIRLPGTPPQPIPRAKPSQPAKGSTIVGPVQSFRVTDQDDLPGGHRPGGDDEDWNEELDRLVDEFDALDI